MTNKLGTDCFSCTATSAVVLLGAGTALASGLVFKNAPNLTRTYVNSMRAVGGVLLPLGGIRSYQAYEAYKSEYN